MNNSKGNCDPYEKFLLEKCWVASACCENALGPSHDMTNYTGQFTFNYTLQCSPQWRSTGNGKMFYIIFNMYFKKSPPIFSFSIWLHAIISIQYPDGLNINIYRYSMTHSVRRSFLENIWTFDGDKSWSLSALVSSLPDGRKLYVSLESQLAVFCKSRFIQSLATMTEIKGMMLLG